MKIYVASSWRNSYQRDIVLLLKNQGHEVYDFKNPKPGDDGFSWREVDPDWQNWDPEQFRRSLKHPTAEDGFNSDMMALKRCACCVLVLPCGRSAHLELGWAVGSGKSTVVFMPEKSEPELMYRMVDFIITSRDELIECIKEIAESMAFEEQEKQNDRKTVPS